MSLALRDGGIVLTVKLGSATLEKMVKPTKVRFDDNQWHKVLVHRKVSEVCDHPFIENHPLIVILNRLNR